MLANSFLSGFGVSGVELAIEFFPKKMHRLMISFLATNVLL